MTILSTTDYSIFKTVTGNREISRGHVSKLADAIDNRNMLSARPIIVNAEFEVIDGQHRLEAAKLLNVPIYYVVMARGDYKDVAILNEAAMNWSSGDYVTMFAKQGYPQYKKLEDLVKDYDISVSYVLHAIKMVDVHSGSYSRDSFVDNELHIFKSGDFVLPQKTEIELRKYLNMLQQVKDLVNRASVTRLKRKFIYTKCFFSGFLSFLIKYEDNISFDKFLNNLELKIDALTQKTRSAEYRKLFLEIYNWHASYRIPE